MKHAIIGLAGAFGIGLLLGGCGNAAREASIQESYFIGGVVQNLKGSGLKLANNGGDLLEIKGNGVFSFAEKLSNGSSYSVKVVAQPLDPVQNCSVSSNDGRILNDNVKSVLVDCSDKYALGGAVQGLQGTGLVIVNADREIALSPEESSFNFGNVIAENGEYSISIKKQPENPKQECSLENGLGSQVITDVSSVIVRCLTYRKLSVIAGGIVEGKKFTISNGLEKIQVSSNSDSYAFPSLLLTGSTYSLAITDTPIEPWQECQLNTIEGVVGNQDIFITVVCSIISRNIIVNVIGLKGSGLRLINGFDTLDASVDGKYTFSSPVLSGNGYMVNVSSSPKSPSQFCTPANGLDPKIRDIDVVVNVKCDNQAFQLGGKISGLSNGTYVELANIDGQKKKYFANGDFYFDKLVSSGAPYEVGVSTPPSGQYCSVSRGKGNILDQPISNVNINCSYKIQGTLTGLESGTSIQLINNGGLTAGGDDLLIKNNGMFELPPMANGQSNYLVSIGHNPISPWQTCYFLEGVSKLLSISGNNVDRAINLVVSCETNRYDISAKVSGLAPGAIVHFAYNGIDIVANQNNQIILATSVPSGYLYDVQVTVPPTDEGCQAENGKGVLQNSAVTVNIKCSGLAFIAGNMGGWGNADGKGKNARFKDPQRIAKDTDGNFYVSDGNLIRKISATGVVETIAGIYGIAGYVDGTGLKSKFSSPQGIAVEKNGAIYIADSGNNLIRKLVKNLQGTYDVTTFAGGAGVLGSTNGYVLDARFYMPQGLAIDSNGDIYITDSGNGVIRKIALDANGKYFVSTVAGTARSFGYSDGDAINKALFHTPNGLALDYINRIMYVVDSFYNTIRKIDISGTTWTVSSIAGSATSPAGTTDGDGSIAKFNYPTDVAVDQNGQVYIADTGNYTIRKVVKSGTSFTVSTIAGLSGILGHSDSTYPGDLGTFNFPEGVVIDSSGNVMVVDTRDGTIRLVSQKVGLVVSTFAGWAIESGNSDGSGADARFYSPTSLAIGSGQNVFVAENGGSDVRMITDNGATGVQVANITAPLKTGNSGWSQISGIVTSGSGLIYFADTTSSTIESTLEINATSLDLVAGVKGQNGLVNGSGKTAKFSGQNFMTRYPNGDLLVSEYYNQAIRKVTFSSTGTTVSTLVNISYPTGIALGQDGSIYVGNWSQIFRVDPQGVVKPFAGVSGKAGYLDGTLGEAQFSGIQGIAISDSGDIYVADASNNLIRKISRDGIVSTVAGTFGVNGFTPGPLPGILNYPLGLAIKGDQMYLTTSEGVAVIYGLP